MTSSQDAVPQRQDSSGAAKTVPVAAALAAALVCLALLIVVSQGTGYARDVAITTTLSIGLAAGASYATWRIAVNRAQGALSGAGIQGLSLDDRYHFLRAAFDALPEDIFVVDEGDCCVIGNRALAKRLSLQPEALTGAPMERFVPAASLAHYEELNRRARQRASVQTKVHRITLSGEPRVTRSEHFPMGELADITGAVLVVDRDLTGITVAHEKDSRMTTQLVRALVKLLDGRDPFAAHHSAKVAIVAHAIVQEVQSDDGLAQTAKLAGSLLNVGKILAPTDLLVREGDLTEEERERVRDGIKASADLVSHIEFPGPVVDTLRQVFEKWDGSGVPRGLKGDEILITAQAVSLANRFVALISPRAYRGAIGIDEAIADLKRESGTTYGPDIVAALETRLRDRTTLESLE